MRQAMRLVVMAAVLGMAGATEAAGLKDDFGSYSVGTCLTQLVAQGWGASDTGTMVTNEVYGRTGGDHVAAINATNAAINTTMASQVGKVWSECLVNEATRMELVTLPRTIPLVSVVAAVTTDGYAVVYNKALGGWDLCTNDARGQAIATGLASGVWARVSILQDYSAHKYSVFMDGRLVRQNLSFITNRDDSLRFAVRAGGPDTAYLDDVYLSNAIPAALLGPLSSTNDINGDGLPDAQELMTYGALAVCATGDYSSISAALAANPVGGRIVVTPGSHAESLVISNATTLIGSVLTNLASLTVATGQVATLSGITNFGCGSLTLGTNASLALGGGTATVSSLVIQSGGAIHVTNGTLIADGVTLTGTFTVDSGWNGVTPQGLNYTNDFEAYPVGMPLNRCGAQGWGASSPDSVIEGTNAHASTKAALVAAGTLVSNTVNGTGGKVWTDFYFNDTGSRAPGVPYPAVDTAKAGMMFVNSNNYVTIWNNGAWDVCSNDIMGNTQSAGLAVPAGQWWRLTVCQDFTGQKLALFVNGILVRQQVPFIGNGISGYHHITAQAGNGSACVDDVKIWTSIPPGLTNDLDGDGIPDAEEIQNCGNTFLWPRGSVFKIR